MNPGWNRAWKDSEQETTRFDSNMQRSQSSNVDKIVSSSTERLVVPKHVQKTQPSEDDQTVLSGTETSVTLKHEESGDPALIHKPRNETNEVLKAKVLQNIGRKLDVSSLHQFLVNQALR